jgi:hypothetical protein
MNRPLGPAELKRRQPAHMSEDNHTVLVDHDRLQPTVLFQGRCYLIDGTLGNLARVFSYGKISLNERTSAFTQPLPESTGNARWFAIRFCQVGDV